MKKWYRQYETLILLLFGTVIVSLFFIPYMILGEKSYIPFHDQLDGEVLNYIYRAKYLLSGENVIPEFMNGMDKGAMVPPAPMGIVFYLLFNPFTAYVVMQWCMMMTGFLGMFLLVFEITGGKKTAFLIACLFAYLPFYPVYGLAIWGQPLLLWGFMQLYHDRRKIGAVISILIYALFSSLVLVGFAWIIFGVIASVLLVFFGNRNKKRAGNIAAGTFLLTFVFLFCNTELIKEFFGKGGGYTTHRLEMSLSAVPFSFEGFKDIWVGNGIYSPTCASGIALLAMCIVGRWIYLRIKSEKNGETDQKIENYHIAICILLALTIVIVLAGQIWNGEFILGIRERLGGVFRYFQASRVSWTLPVWWYLILTLCCRVIYKGYDKWNYTAKYVLLAIVFLVTAAGIFKISPLNKNLRLMAFSNTYKQITWADIYAQDVFKKIGDRLPEDKSNYRVASIGMYPSAALFHGFYCMDGYSNNYSLEYKHEFREIIGNELEKNGDIKWYFDEWGNRCYLMTSQTGYSTLISKDSGIVLEHLELNIEKFYEMGGRYIFSAVSISNAEEIGLTVLSGSPFSTEESFYQIWVYEVR